MKKVSSSLRNMVAVMMSTAIVVGGLLASVNHLTAEPIRQQAEQALSEGICHVMDTHELIIDTVMEVTRQVSAIQTDFWLYKISDKSHAPIGTAVKTSVQGFSDKLNVLVGFGKDGVITGYTILPPMQETPGLGAKVDTWFQKGGKGSIIGKNPSKDCLAVKKDGGEIDGITASTITSRAFLSAVKEAYETSVATCPEKNNLK